MYSTEIAMFSFLILTKSMEFTGRKEENVLLGQKNNIMKFFQDQNLFQQKENRWNLPIG